MQMSPQMKKMLTILSIVLIVIFGWYGLRKALFFYFFSHYQPPAVTISAAKATKKDWQSYLTSVGTLTAVNGVDISAEVSGIVKEIRFDSSQFVNQGDVLVVLDTSVEQAQLKDNLAKLKLAQINYDRDKILMKKNVTSQSVLDTDLATLQAADAGVQQTQARINQKTVKAPFSGKIGIRLINLGEYVAAGTNMVTLQAQDPLYVRFNLPEQYVSELSLNQHIQIHVAVNNSDDNIVEGKITAINSKVDQATRNILIQATIPNPQLKLYPGMFALVTIWLVKHKDVITLPQTSISYSLHGDSVFVIRPDKKDKTLLNAYRIYVKVGERRGDEVSIVTDKKAGPDQLVEGDQVASSGQLKLQNGTRVEIDNSVEL